MPTLPSGRYRTLSLAHVLLETGVEGTAFAVAPNLFLTNYHVVDQLIFYGQPLSSFNLVQKGTRRVLKVHSIPLVSGLYDVAVVRTTTSVSHYLELARNFTLEQASNLSYIGYPDGTRLIANQISNVRYFEDALSYGFGLDTHRESLLGGSGGPILDSRGKAVGMLHTSDTNYILGVKARHLRDLIFDTEIKEGLLCPQPQDPWSCHEEERKYVKLRASQGMILALFQTGRPDSHINDKKEDWESSIERLKEAAVDFPLAGDYLGSVYYDFSTKRHNALAIAAFRRAARSGLPSAQNMLAFMHYHGLGTTKNYDLARELARKSMEGGYRPAEELLDDLK